MATMKFGFEREYFLTNELGQVILPQAAWNLPLDSCGWLVEARGQPQPTIVEAAFSTLAAEHVIRTRIDELRKLGNDLRLCTLPIQIVPKSLRIAARRISNKGIVKYQNFYGHAHHGNENDEQTAGIHFSVTKSVTSVDRSNIERTYNINFDWPLLFCSLDQEFKQEIECAKRKPGFYEMKEDGRVEWRSLPNDIPMEVVGDRITKIFDRVRTGLGLVNFFT